MRPIVVSLCLFLAAALLFITPVQAQSNAVNGLEIKVVTKKGDVVATAKTRVDGSFSFTVKEVGEYYITSDENQLSEARIVLAQQGVPVAAKKAKKAAKKASQKSAEAEVDAPEADVDIIATFEENLKYDVKYPGGLGETGPRWDLIVRNRAEKLSPVLYVSRTNTPVMGKATWDLKKGK